MKTFKNQWNIVFRAKCYIEFCSMRRRPYEYFLNILPYMAIRHRWLQNDVDDEYRIYFSFEIGWLFWACGFLLRKS